MTFHRVVTKEQLTSEILDEIANLRSEIQALEDITILDHKTLTNKAISGGKYVELQTATHATSSSQKQLRYAFDFQELGRRRIEHGSVNAYAFTGEVDGIRKVTRICTPSELEVNIHARIDYLKLELMKALDARALAAQLAANHNRLIDEIEKHNESVHYSAKLARI